MNEIRRSATSRLEAGEATWLAWSSATDDARAQTNIDETDLTEAELEEHDEPYNLRSNGDIADTAPSAMRGALPAIGGGARQQADDYYVLEATSISRSPSSSIRTATINGGNGTKVLRPCRSVLLNDNDDDEAKNEFEPVGDLPSLPRLDYKPLIIRNGTLISIATFYLGLIGGLGTLYYYENNARIFHIHATAGRFTIRILPSLIGSLSTLMFQSVLTNFARIVPYIDMAAPVHKGDQCAPARQTIFAGYFPPFDFVETIRIKHFGLTAMYIVQLYLNPFITPAKSTLIHKKASEQDPDHWTITISGGAAMYLMFNYSVLFLAVFGLLFFLWDRRTGLKWDPVSLADHMMLLQGSDILEDFSGLEYYSSNIRKRMMDGKGQYQGLAKMKYRLGYWRHRRTNEYWHGIRKWSTFASNEQDLTVPNGQGLRHSSTQEPGHNSLSGSSLSPIAASPLEPSRTEMHSGISLAAREYTITRQYATNEEAPSIKDRSSKALTWWRIRCNEVLKKPNKCYRHVYLGISDYFATLTYVFVAGSAGFGIWVIWTDRLTTGFTFPLRDSWASIFVLQFVPTFWFGLINGFWYQIDIWYRQLQPYMGLRQPSPATENLLLGYLCDLPIIITIRALGAGHWRLAFTSIMPLVQRSLPIIAGSLLTVDTTTSKGYFHIIIAATPFKSAVGILCAYLVLIPVVWPGRDRRLPIVPVCIADSIVMFYDSTLVRNDAFLPHGMNEKRWHMKYRLCLEQRLYGFGIYPGRYGALHVGIDDVYGYHEDDKGLRFVAPLKPPVRFYRRWLKKGAIWSAKKLHIQRKPTFHEEESEALRRLHTHLQDPVDNQTTPNLSSD